MSKQQSKTLVETLIPLHALLQRQWNEALDTESDGAILIETAASEIIGTRVRVLEDAIFRAPVEGFADLALKMQLLANEHLALNREWIDCLVADVRQAAAVNGVAREDNVRQFPRTATAC